MRRTYGDNFVGESIEVLDKGYVKLIDYMGSDERVVWCARRSVQDPNKKNRPDDHLIDYLVRMKHHSPLEHCSVTFELKLPLFVFAHYVRHRTGKFSSMSLRYSSPEELDFYVPSKERIESASAFNFDETEEYSQFYILEGVCQSQDAMGLYRDAQEHHKWPSELARIYLPQNMYTNVAITMDLRNLLHMIKERSAKGAQWESQQYANAMLEFVQPLFPKTVEAWINHDRDSFTFSAMEMTMLLSMLNTDTLVNEVGSIIGTRDARILREKFENYKEKMK